MSGDESSLSNCRDLVISPRIRIPRDELAMTFARSAGPGGQNVNKLNTKATVRWSVVKSRCLPEMVRARLLARERRRITGDGELIVVSQRFRQAGRNAADCLEKLRAIVRAASYEPKPRRATRPTRGSVERRLSEKRRRSERKTDRKTAD